MNENRTTQLICIAAVAGAFGVRGEIRLKSFTDDPLACTSYGPLRNETGAIILTPTEGRLQKGMVIIRAPEVKTREKADALKSTKLYVPRETLPDPHEDEFYYSDLLGLTVQDTNGDSHGKIKALHDFGGGDVLEINKPGEKSWFHPFTKDSVPEVNIKHGYVIIDIIEAETVELPDDE